VLDVQNDDTIGNLCRKIQESLRIQDAITVHVHGYGQLSPDTVILEKFPTGGITFNVSIDNSTRSKKANKSMKLVEPGPNGEDTIPFCRNVTH
jgi:hypothetical protein